MAHFKCPIHGGQIACAFCEHAKDAVDERRPMEVFLHKDRWGWITLCPTCILAPIDNDAITLVCSDCMVEWSVEIGSDYHERIKAPVNEFPDTKPDSESSA